MLKGANCWGAGRLSIEFSTGRRQAAISVQTDF